MFDLANASRERNNLVSVIEGGFNVMQATEWPATLDMELAVSLEIDVEGDEYDLDIRLELTRDDGARIDASDYIRKGRLSRVGGAPSAPMSIVLPFVPGTAKILIPEPGVYRFTLFDHDDEVSFIRFYAEEISEHESDS